MEKLSTLFLASVLAFVACAPSILAFTPASPFGTRHTQSSPRTIFSMSAVAEQLPSRSDSSFESRMRKIVLAGTRQKKKISTSQQSQRPSNLKVVRSLKEYKAVVGSESERIVAVRFFAPWCKACKAMAPLFYRMANNCPNVLFVEVPVTEKNANLHQGLGVHSLPFGHLYAPGGGLVEEQSISRKNIGTFAKKLKSYMTGYCEIENLDMSSPYPQPEEDPKLVAS